MAFTQKKFITYENINKYVIGSGGNYLVDGGSSNFPGNYYMPVILWSGYVYASSSTATSWYTVGTCGLGVSSVSVSYSQYQLTVTLSKYSDANSVICTSALVNDRCYWSSNSGNQRGTGYNTWKTVCSSNTVTITYVCQQDSNNDSCMAGRFNHSFFYPSGTEKNKVSGYGGINLIIYGYISWNSNNSIYYAYATDSQYGSSNYILSASNHYMPDKMIPCVVNLQYAYQTTVSYPYCLAILKISRGGSIYSSLYSTSNAGSTLSASVSVPNARYIQITLSATNGGSVYITGLHACGCDCAGYTSGRGSSGGMQQFTCCNSGATIYVSALQQRNDNNDSWDCTTEFGSTSTRRFNYFYVYIFGYISKIFSFNDYQLRLTYMDPSTASTGYSPLMWLMPRSGEIYIYKTTYELMTRIPVTLFWGTISFSSGTPSFTLYHNSKIDLSTSYTSTTVTISMTNNDTYNYVYGYCMALNNSSVTGTRSYGFPIYYCSTSGNNNITIWGFRQSNAKNDSWSQITWSEYNYYSISVMCLGYTNISEAQEAYTYYSYSNAIATSNISATANGSVTLQCRYTKYTYTNGSQTNSQNVYVNVTFNVTPNMSNTTREISTDYTFTDNNETITISAIATQNAATGSVFLRIGGDWSQEYYAYIYRNNAETNIMCIWTITRTYNGSTTQLYQSDTSTDVIDVTQLNEYLQNTSAWETQGATYTITANVDPNDSDYTNYEWSSTTDSVTRSLTQSSSVTLSVSATTISNGGYVTLTITPSVAGDLVIYISDAAYNAGLRLNLPSATYKSVTRSNVSTSGTTISLYNKNTSTTSNTTVSANNVWAELTPSDSGYEESMGYLSSTLTLKAVSQNSSSVTLSVSATTISNGGYVTLTATPSVAGTIVINIPTAAYNSGLRLNTSSNTSKTYTMSNVTTSGSTVRLYNVNSSTSSNATVSANTIYGTLTPTSSSYSSSTGYLSSALTLTKASSSNTYSISGDFCSGYQLKLGSSTITTGNITWTIKRSGTTVANTTLSASTPCCPPSFIPSNKFITTDYGEYYADGQVNITNNGSGLIIFNAPNSDQTTIFIPWDPVYLSPNTYYNLNLAIDNYALRQVVTEPDGNHIYAAIVDYASVYTDGWDNHQVGNLINGGTINLYQRYSNTTMNMTTCKATFKLYSSSYPYISIQLNSDIILSMCGIMIDNANIEYTIEATYNGSVVATTRWNTGDTNNAIQLS